MLDIKVLPQTTIRVKKNKRSAMFTIQNNSMESVGYKIKTTRPRDYVVRPNMGMIIPMQHVDIEVTLSENTVPDSTHKFLIEVYQFDWRKSVNDFKQYLRSAVPRPAWTSRIGIVCEGEKKEKEAVTAGSSGNPLLMFFSYVYLVLNTVYLFYRLFQ